MDFEYIKRCIVRFKSKNIFEEAEYKKILDDLDNLYKIKNNFFFNLTINEYILKEKENFIKYLIGGLLQSSNELAKSQKFQLALKNLNKLKVLNPPENVIREVEKIWLYCEIGLNWNKGEELIKEKKFQQAINHFKNMKEISNNVIQNDVYNKGLKLAKVAYINSFSNELTNLMKEEEGKKKKEKLDENDKMCETVFDEFKS